MSGSTNKRPLAAKVALITGASSGIGAAIAKHHVAPNLDRILLDRILS
jgi:NADP-dependent 3-hydroxy acid dehydrogenase YdfG